MTRLLLIITAWSALTLGGFRSGGTLALANDPTTVKSNASQFVQSFSVIRVGIPPAPGNGHQAYTLTVMKRLRELGFKGRFEVFYHPSTKAKLGYLLPGFRGDGPATQMLPTGGITAYEWRPDLAPLERGRAVLGILGGDDFNISPKELGVDAVIRFHPSGWHRAPKVEYEENGVPIAQREFERLRLQPTRVSRSQYDEPLEFLTQQMGENEKLRAKIPGLLALLENGHRLETLAAYGLGFKNGPMKLALLIAAIAEARATSPHLFLGPIVIPLLSNFNPKERQEFLALISDHQKKNPFALRWMDSTSAVAKQTIEALTSDEILVMPVGSVPQDVWHEIVGRSSLPPTVAGTSGINFVKQRGRPFINTADTEMGLFTPRAEEKPTQRLRNFILDSLDPNSSLSLKYQKFAPRRPIGVDKVEAVLDESEKFFREIFQIDLATDTPDVTENLIRALRKGDTVVARLSLVSLGIPGLSEGRFDNWVEGFSREERKTALRTIWELRNSLRWSSPDIAWLAYQMADIPIQVPKDDFMEFLIKTAKNASCK